MAMCFKCGFIGNHEAMKKHDCAEILGMRKEVNSIGELSKDM